MRLQLLQLNQVHLRPGSCLKAKRVVVLRGGGTEPTVPCLGQVTLVAVQQRAHKPFQQAGSVMLPQRHLPLGRGTGGGEVPGAL